MFKDLKLPHVVAFCGYAGCGKDTAADVLEMFGYQRIAFADALRNAVSEMFDIPVAHMLDRKLKETPIDRPPYKSPREILQYVGTEGMRSYYPTIWVDKIRRKIEANPEQRYVITDWRFPNEGEFLTEIGALRVRLDRRGVDRKFVHASESHIDTMPVDEVIRNDGKDLYLFQKEVLVWAVSWTGRTKVEIE